MVSIWLHPAILGQILPAGGKVMQWLMLCALQREDPGINPCVHMGFL